MANLLGLIVTWLTFPGVILHEWSHKFFCDRAGVPVYEVKYFRLGNPAGYVRHGEITRYRDAFLVTIAPFIINSIFAIFMFITPIFKFNGIIDIFFMWLGFSFAMHAFPSDGDAKHLWAHSQKTWRANPIALIGFPLVVVIFIANLLRIFWFDLIYAGILFGVTFGLVGSVIIAGSTLTGIPTATISPQYKVPTPGTSSPYEYTTGSADLGINVSITGKGDLANKVTLYHEDSPYYNIPSLVTPLVDIVGSGPYDTAWVTMSYNQSSSGNPLNYTMCYYNESLGLYVPVPTRVNTVNHTLSASFTHFNMVGGFDGDALYKMYADISQFNYEALNGAQ